MSAVLASTVYAEGLWVPFLGAVTDPTGLTYATQVGKYTRIGNLVVASFDMLLSSMGTGGAGFISLGGLPIPVMDEEPTLFNNVGGSGFTGAGVALATMFIIPVAGVPTASITINSLSAGTVFLDYSYVTNASRINGTFSYHVVT